jgi:CRP-like cAMP-binding protein
MLVLHLKRHETELLSFLKTIPLLKTFPNSQLKKLVGYFAPVKKIIHSFVYKENTPSTHVYIVKEGEFRVTRRVSKEQVKNEPLPKDVYDDPLKSMKGQSKYFVKNIAT